MSRKSIFSKFYKIKIWEYQSTLFLTLNSMKCIRKLNSKHFSTNSENSSFSTSFRHLKSSCSTSGFKIQLRDFFFRIPHSSKYPEPCGHFWLGSILTDFEKENKLFVNLRGSHWVWEWGAKHSLQVSNKTGRACTWFRILLRNWKWWQIMTIWKLPGDTQVHPG